MRKSEGVALPGDLGLVALGKRGQAGGGIGGEELLGHWLIQVLPRVVVRAPAGAAPIRPDRQRPNKNTSIHGDLE